MGLSVQNIFMVTPHLPFRFKVEFFGVMEDLKMAFGETTFFVKSIKTPILESGSEDNTIFLGNGMITIPTFNPASRELEITFEETDIMGISKLNDVFLLGNSCGWFRPIIIGITEYTQDMNTVLRRKAYHCRMKEYTEPQFSNSGGVNIQTLTLTFKVDSEIDWDGEEIKFEKDQLNRIEGLTKNIKDMKLQTMNITTVSAKSTYKEEAGNSYSSGSTYQANSFGGQTKQYLSVNAGSAVAKSQREAYLSSNYGKMVTVDCGGYGKKTFAVNPYLYLTSSDITPDQKQKLIQYVQSQQTSRGEKIDATVIVEGALKYGKKYGVDPLFLLSIWNTETHFTQNRGNNLGTVFGMTQILDDTWNSITSRMAGEGFITSNQAREWKVKRATRVKGGKAYGGDFSNGMDVERQMEVSAAYFYYQTKINNGGNFKNEDGSISYMWAGAGYNAGWGRASREVYLNIAESRKYGVVNQAYYYEMLLAIGKVK